MRLAGHNNKNVPLRQKKKESDQPSAVSHQLKPLAHVTAQGRVVGSHCSNQGMAVQYFARRRTLPLAASVSMNGEERDDVK